MTYDISIKWATGGEDHTVVHNETMLEYEISRLRSRPEVQEVSYTDELGEHSVFKRDSNHQRRFGY